jgi:hypothetical protein
MTFLLALALVLAPTHLAKDTIPPGAPTVAGPRNTTETQPVYAFKSSDRGTPAAKLRFRCAFDSRTLRSCAPRYSETLSVGRHVLRVQAVDLSGNRSAVTVVKVTVRDASVGAGDIMPTASIEIGGFPRDVSFGFGSVWVTDPATGSVLRVDPATNAIVARIPAGGVRAIAAGAGGVWTANPAENRIVRIDPASNAVVASVAVPEASVVAAGPEGVWANGFRAPGQMRLARIDPATNTISFTLDADVAPGAVAVGGGYAWIKRGDGLLKIDAATNAIIGSTTIVSGAQLAYGPSGLWSLFDEQNPLNPVVARVDPATLALQPLRTTGRSPPRCFGRQGGLGLAVDTTRVWVVHACVIDELDAATGARLHEYVSKDRVASAALGAASAWIIDSDAGLLLRFDNA